MTGKSFQTLVLDGVKRDFGSFNALRGLDLVVERGEFIALLGPSGCGKTTALNCIAGLLAVTGGQILLDDQRIDTLRPEQRGFGMVFQNYALFPHMNVRRNVGFGLRMQGVARAETTRRVDRVLEMVHLTEQADKLPGQLSGGQQQRVAIARAVVIEPALVLMDEPLSNLDAKLRLEMRQEIRRIHAQIESTTIYVTHDQEEALSLADRIVVLRDGAIRQVGTPADLYFRPAHLDVADFMGYRNRLPGRLCGNNALDIGGTVLVGRAAGDVNGTENAIAAIRPDDLHPRDDATGVPAVIEAIEFRGREFHGLARTEAGQDLYFSSARSLVLGETVHLGADPERVLLFPGETA
jgi:putative spermidine/putrescine transport system ATP-binding protein